MEAVIGLLLMLLGVSHGAETYCDGRQDGAQCYGALGGTVVLQLMDNTSDIFRYDWRKNAVVILQGRKNKIVFNLIEDRSSFSPSDGTFGIKNLSRTDGGEYTLTIYDSSGRLTERRTLQLTIQSAETYCDGRQDGAQCYGALEGTVVLQLMDNTSDIFRYDWRKNAVVILQGRKNKIVFNLIEDRSSYSPSDGTFRIKNLSRTDGGEYTLTIYDSSGRLTARWTLQLTIQAPVSSVLLVSECLSQGEMRVSCSSEGGDSPQYSWTLDGQTLTDAQLLSGSHESKIITLRRDVSGQLICSVRNHISSVSKQEMISACGAETYCDGRQDGAQCYGALGGAVVVQLMDSASEIFKYQLFKNTTEILHGRKNKIVSNLIEDRSSFTPSDGTFGIKSLSRTDGGEYTLRTFDSNGRQTARRTLQLTIQSPVSSVLLVSECLSQGEVRVSCSSEGGDSPQYSWTLDGQTLTDAQLLSGSHESKNITLRRDVSGQLICSVRNHISRVSTCGFIFICSFTVDHSLLICGVEAAVMILILTGIYVYFALKKKKRETSERTTVRRKMEHQENSVLMVEMRSSASEPTP